MRSISDIWRSSILLLFISGMCGNICAQKVVFTAEANATKICTKEHVQVQYTIKDAQNLQTISKLSDADFIVVAGPYQQQSANTCFIGNRAIQSLNVSFTYILQPKHEGTFTIPPMAARDAAGHTYTSNALTIHVVNGQSLVQHSPTR